MPFGFYTGITNVEVLMEMVCNKNLDLEKRIRAIFDLSLAPDFDSHRLLEIVSDKTQASSLRGEIFDQHVWNWDARSIPVILEALQEDNAEIQFWATYAILSIRWHWQDAQLEQIISLLNQVIRNDNIAPDMWHIGREALYPLERAYYRKINSDKHDKVDFRVISPRLEYWDFMQARQRGDVIVEPTLQLETEWLKEKIASRFKSAKFDVRRSKPDVYRLDWCIGYGKFPLYGALHRDAYAIVLCGLTTSVLRFAEWYRRIIPDEHVLRLYHWGDQGEIL